VLARARAYRLSERLVFTGAIRGSCLSARALEVLLHRQLRVPYAVHGFRAAFSTFCNETQPFAFEDVEACLAHQTGNSVSRAYDRGEKLVKRAAIMQTWGNYVTGMSVNVHCAPCIDASAIARATTSKTTSIPT
jgi:hypothetical protein